MKRALHKLSARFADSDVAIAHTFRRPPWGGANQFLLALREELQGRGLRVGETTIGRNTRACLLNAFLFDTDKVRATRRPDCRLVHRVDGPVDLYRGGESAVDRKVEELNREFADVTVFQSAYSLDAHRELGIELRNPVLIPNAVDPRIFHPPQTREPHPEGKIRLIASSWSDNPNKGAPALKELEGLLDPDRFDFTFVGRTQIDFERIRVLPAMDSERLAGVLRGSDIFIAPSLHDPCSNAVIEALSCGLPVVYANSGGHPELVGDAGFGFDSVEEVPALLDRLVEELDDRRARIRTLSMADVTDRYMEAMGIDAGATAR